MVKFTEFVKASEIWDTAKDYIDEGNIDGLLRGFNVEIEKKGKTGWMACDYIVGEPEDYFNDDFHQWIMELEDYRYTGRICFRGYYIAKYDPVERDEFFIACDSKGNLLKCLDFN